MLKSLISRITNNHYLLLIFDTNEILRLLLFEHCKFQLNQSKIGGVKIPTKNSTFDPKSSIPITVQAIGCALSCKTTTNPFTKVLWVTELSDKVLPSVAPIKNNGVTSTFKSCPSVNPVNSILEEIIRRIWVRKDHNHEF
jgi:hypothetical protein